VAPVNRDGLARGVERLERALALDRDALEQILGPLDLAAS